MSKAYLLIADQATRLFEHTITDRTGDDTRAKYKSTTASACGCGPKYTVTLTDARLIQRGQGCSCCGTGPHIDTMLFLSDISSITDSVVGKGCCSCGYGCGSSCCAGTAAKQIGFTGPFGTLVFTFNVNDILNALVQIPAAALRHKTS